MSFLSVTCYLFVVLAHITAGKMIIDYTRSGMCDIKNVHILENQQHVNFPERVPRCSHIKMMDSKLYTIPAELLSPFPKVISVSAINCDLETINKQMFTPKLTHFIVPKNKITTLEDNVFALGKELQSIDLSENKIGVVEASAFQFLDKLTTLNLSGNRIAALASTTFGDLKSLITLKLDSNEITGIDSDLFRNTTKLSNLNLRGNKIREIPGYCFEKNHNLDILTLADNLIEKIEDNAFQGLGNVDTLNLSGNRLYALKNATFTGQINHLYLNNNVIEIVNFDIFRNSVVDLQLSSNRIQILQATRYNSITKVLNLADNLMTNVTTIRKFRQLEILNLSANQHLQLLPSTIGGLTALKALFLKGTDPNNWIDNRHQNKWFEDLPNLEELDLSFNNLKEMDINTFARLPSLIKMDLDSSNLTEIRNYEIFTRTFPKLNGLKLLGNDFTCEFLHKLLKVVARPEMVFADCPNNEETNTMTTTISDQISSTDFALTSTTEDTTTETSSDDKDVQITATTPEIEQTTFQYRSPPANVLHMDNNPSVDSGTSRTRALALWMIIIISFIFI